MCNFHFKVKILPGEALLQPQVVVRGRSGIYLLFIDRVSGTEHCWPLGSVAAACRMLTTFHHCSIARCGISNFTFKFTSIIRAEEAGGWEILCTGAGMERSRYSGNLRHFYCFDAFLCDAAAAYLQTTPVAGPESCSEDNLTQAFPGPGEMGRCGGDRNNRTM